MGELAARPVDQRDTRWEITDPAYRVTFWRPTGPSGAWASREFEITGGDAPSVFEWVTRNAEPDEFATVYALVRSGELGLVRLAGADPTRAAPRTERG